MQFLREEFIEIPGFTIAAKVWGMEEGLPVLAMHGWLDNAASFDPLLSVLDAPLKVFAVDAPGCGKSSHDSIAAVPSIMTEMFHMFLIADALGWKRFSVIGHSRGAAVASLMAAAAPERVERAVFLEGLGMWGGRSSDLVQQLRESLASYLRPLRLKGTVYPDIDSAARVRMKSWPLDFESAKLLTQRGTQTVQGGVTWCFDRRHQLFRSVWYPDEDQALAYLRGIECPCCVILAEQGIPYAQEQLASRLDALKDKEKHVVPGRHHVHMDSPELIVPIVDRFLRKQA